MEVQENFDYLNFSVEKLLDEFGKGKHVPGSGSAAAFTGLIGLELIKTICNLTLEKKDNSGNYKYQNIHPNIKEILSDIEKSIEELKIILVEDAKTFDIVYQYRIKRDEALKNGDNKKFTEYSKLEKDFLEKVTHFPVNLAKECIKCSNHAFYIFDKGFQTALGDSGAAISNLLASISSSLFIILLNIKTMNDGPERNKLIKEADYIDRKYRGIREEAFTILEKFRNKTLLSPLKLNKKI